MVDVSLKLDIKFRYDTDVLEMEYHGMCFFFFFFDNTMKRVDID
jgi:hypothetical protein